MQPGYRTWQYARRVIPWTLETALEAQGVLVRLRRTRRRRQDALTLGMKIVRYLLSPNASNQDPEHIESLRNNLYTLELEMDELRERQEAADNIQEEAFLQMAMQLEPD